MTTPTTPDVRAEALAVVAYLVTGLVRGEPSICFEDERGDYGDEDHTPIFDALVRLSDAESALKARDAEIERLRGALARIERWELPATGKFWDDEKTRPTSYEAEYGSNGARDYMRALAGKALDQARATGGETAK